MSHWVVLKIAARNVFLHRMRTLIVGAILTFGAFLAILGHTFVNGVAGGMKNSTTQSVTGDIQIFGENAKEKLSVFGNMDGSASDVGHVDNFQKVADTLMQNKYVASVVPMGTSNALVNPGNILDHYLETLRKSFKGADLSVSLDSQKKRIRFLIEEIQRNLEGKFEEIGILSPEDAESAHINLRTATSDKFWQDFDANYESKIEFLANKIAPLIFDDNMYFFNYVGTDPDKFKEKFPQFEVVKGEMIPSGQRGFLFHDFFYENFVKHRIARRLDKVKKQITEEKLTIKDSKEVQDQIKANVNQSAEIYLQLGPEETLLVKNKLKELLSSKEDDFRVLIKEFLDMNDQNFMTRFDFFYKEIAPHIILYRVKIGEVLPMNAYTKAGSSTSINIKVYGTFKFKSYENSPLAGNFSLMDLISFRELYGFLTEERRQQNKELEAEMALADVGRDSIEDLFGTSGSEGSKTNSQFDSGGGSNSNANLDSGASAHAPMTPELSFTKKVIASNYTPEELNQGVFMHAAVILKDPDALSKAIQSINELSKKENLGIQAVSWQDAAGFIGQLTFMMKAVLNIFIGIALLLAGLMITNSLLMAAMNRKQEIGTMRAIGAHASFIYRLFFYETLFISLLFGGIGVLIGSLIVLTIGANGIPASGDVMTFFFSGPRLFLHLEPSLVFIVLFFMVIIAVLATQYPAWKAMKISPLQAMQKKD